MAKVGEGVCHDQWCESQNNAEKPEDKSQVIPKLYQEPGDYEPLLSAPDDIIVKNLPGNVCQDFSSVFRRLLTTAEEGQRGKWHGIEDPPLVMHLSRYSSKYFWLLNTLVVSISVVVL